MTSGTIADGPVAAVASDAGRAAGAAPHGKLTDTDRAGGVGVIGSAVSTAAASLGAVPPSRSSATDLHVSWEQEFQEQTSRLAETNDVSSASDPSDDVSDLPDSFHPADAPAAASSTPNPAFPIWRKGLLTASFPAVGQTSGRGKEGASHPGLFVTLGGRAGGNGGPPAAGLMPASRASVPAFSASQITEPPQAAAKSTSSTRTSHGSAQPQTERSHSSSSVLPSASVSAATYSPVASAVLTPLAVPVPVAGNRTPDGSLALGLHAVSEIGSLMASAVFPAASESASEGPTSTSNLAKPFGRGPQGQPSAQASLIASESTASPFRSVLGPRVEPSGAALSSPGSIAENRSSASDLPNATAQWTATRETVSSSLDSRGSGLSGQPYVPSQGVLSAPTLPLAPAQGSPTALPLPGVQPDVHALLQLPGVVAATFVGNPREASVREASVREASVHDASGAPRVLANGDPASMIDLIDSGIVRAGAVNPETRAALGASADSAANPEAARMPGTEALSSAPSQHPAAAATLASPPAQGVPGVEDHGVSPSSASGTEPPPGPALAERLRTEAAIALSALSAAIPAKGRSTDFSSSTGKRDSGFAQGTPLHASGSIPEIASLSHSGPPGTVIAAAGESVPAIRQDSGFGSARTSRNSSGGSDMFDLMDQAPVQATGSDGRIPAASSSASAPRELQIAYQDPVLGYVELRAHSSVNGVHASLEAESAAAGDTLTGHLSALTGWMDERRTPVESLTVSTLVAQPDSGWAQHGRDSAASGQDGGTQAGNRDGGQGGSFGPDPGPSLGIEAGPAATRPLAPHGSAGSFTAPSLPRGSSFSVVA